MKTKIYCTALATNNQKVPFVAMAMEESGKTTHGSGSAHPTESAVQKHFGVSPYSAERQAVLFGDIYPNGYEVTWCDQNDAQILGLLELNRKASGVRRG